MATYGVILPIVQSKCLLFGTTPLLLDADATVRTIKSEHVGAILAHRKGLSEEVNPKAKCLLLNHGTTPPSKEPVFDKALAAAFAMNVFSGGGSISFRRAFFFRYTRAHSIQDIADVPYASNGTGNNFKFDSSATVDTVAALFGGTLQAIQKDQSLRISLRRFNSAVSKPGLEDKVIDLAISLESIFSSMSEISFRFSLYNSLLSGGDAASKANSFKRLKKLYDYRSKIVHGAVPPESQWLDQNWEALVKIAKLSLVAKIGFLEHHVPAEWQAHLDSLALGS